jgi:transposase
MEPTDARKLTHKELTDLRIRGVKAVHGGESPYHVAKVFGVTPQAVYNWLSLYRSGGWDALNAAKRGGRKPKLDSKAMKWLYDAITMKQPEQFKFPFALWTSRMVMDVIRKHLKIKLSKASVCRLLNQLGLSPQRPLWRAYQQNPEHVEKWLKHEYPKIARRAKKEGAEVWFADEAGVRSDQHAGTTWAKKGETPKVKTTGARFGLNVISAISRQGEIRFMCVEGRVNAGVFLDFLKRLERSCARKVFLIVDGHPTHKAKLVTRYLEEKKERIEMFFLPPYSPQLNPDEHVWCDLKNNQLGRKIITGPDMLKRAVISFMRSLQKNPEKVRSYFHAAETAYSIS